MPTPEKNHQHPNEANGLHPRRAAGPQQRAEEELHGHDGDADAKPGIAMPMVEPEVRPDGCCVTEPRDEDEQERVRKELLRRGLQERSGLAGLHWQPARHQIGRAHV